MNIDEYSEEEHRKVVMAEEKYGRFYVNAHDATILLSNIMEWPIIDCDIFIRFLSQMKKYHVLSLISLVRLHRIQAKMNLRYFLESTVHAAYSLVHTDTKNYFDIEEGRKHDAQTASRIAYKWIAGAFSDHSDIIKVGLTRYAGVARPRLRFSDFTWSVGANCPPLALA